jgi:hypothetical protein
LFFSAASFNASIAAPGAGASTFTSFSAALLPKSFAPADFKKENKPIILLIIIKVKANIGFVKF